MAPRSTECTRREPNEHLPSPPIDGIMLATPGQPAVQRGQVGVGGRACLMPERVSKAVPSDRCWAGVDRIQEGTLPPSGGACWGVKGHRAVLQTSLGWPFSVTQPAGCKRPEPAAWDGMRRRTVRARTASDDIRRDVGAQTRHGARAAGRDGSDRTSDVGAGLCGCH